MSPGAVGKVGAVQAQLNTDFSAAGSSATLSSGDDLRSRLKQIEIMVETLDSPEVQGALFETKA